MDQPRERYLWLRRTVPLLGVLLVAGIIYDGAIFYSRWNSERQAERAGAEKEIDHAQKTIDALGGGGLKIVSFYAAPGTIRRGDHTTVCYGVTGAKTVRIDPAIAEVWPALSRCLDASPRKDTEFKLSADDTAGHTVTQSFVIHVR